MFSICTRLAALAAILAAVACSRPSAQASHDSSTVLAELNGRSLTADEVAKGAGEPLARLEEQMYALKRQRIDNWIAQQLLADEAKSRGVTVRALLDEEVTAKVTLVTETEIDAYCEKRPADCQASPARPLESVRAALRTHLQSQKIGARQDALVESLRDRAEVTVHLEPPVPFRAEVVDGTLPARGSATAPVTIVEFSDFHCPFCKRVQPTLAKLLKDYPTQVRLVYRDNPLDRLHPEARKAAEAARCANDQQKYWEFHDRLYDGPADASPRTLQAAAQQVGLDVAAFERCVAGGTHASAVQADATEAARLGLTGTPSFFINGRPFKGAMAYETFVQVVEAELSKK